ncbi:glutathione S-transferase family protein [Haloplanus halophilus]|uniref:glutathione S-transferase family protein n=1 Tax=Haloplanus halophilus TaxID=2949993 RepID=UPI00203B602C|nr:glutathione S-transferase family protein [Haloplanus sp. GDY1]
MSGLVDGEWVGTDYETGDDGEFERQETTFRDRIGPDGSFPIEAGRYHLYISRACPWAHRTAMTRSLKGLDDAISLSLVQPERYDEGWEFSETHPDPLYGAEYLRDVYVRADPDYTGRVTVPVLWDREEETIVNNESEEIMRMLDVEAHELATRDVDLYPEGYRDEVDRLIDDIYDPINNGVYRAGFAGSQAAYDEAVTDLFDALDRYDDLLADQRYLAGDRLTEADLAMFATLVRFDHVYHTHFKCNRRAIHEYDNLWGYTKDLYTTPGIERTVNVDHIVRHYYVSHGDVNPKRLVPIGPDVDFTEGHDRDRLPGGPPEALVE